MRELIEKGDRAHALHHVTSALGLAPERSEWRGPLRDLLGERALLDELLGALSMLPYVPKEYPARVRAQLQEEGHLEGAVPAEPSSPPPSRAPSPPAAPTAAKRPW